MNISIVLATYNGEKYIEEQLDSICCQLDTSDEVIICDDCSTDNTVAIVHEYADKVNSGVKFIIKENEYNLGFQNNFNKALSYANNEYIFFSDQDDVWSEDKISEMVSFIKKTPDCNILCCDYEPWFMNDNQEAPKSVIEKMPNDGSVEKISLNYQSIYIGQLGCCMCIKKEFRDTINDYWFDRWAQDDRCWRMGLCSDGLYLIHRNFVKHRIHENNTATYGKYHTLKKRIELFRQMYDADEQMLKYLRSSKDEGKIKIVDKNSKMMMLRLKQMEKRNIGYSFALLKYIPIYQNKKSFILEGYMALVGK